MNTSDIIAVTVREIDAMRTELKLLRATVTRQELEILDWADGEAAARCRIQELTAELEDLKSEQNWERQP